MIRTLLICTAFIICAVLTTNVAIQRFYCGKAWRDCSPLEWLPCEPISKVEAQWRDYQERAKLQPVKRDE